MDVIIVEAPGMSQNSQPFIVLALEEGVSMEEVQPALFKAKNDSKIKTYKTNRYVDTTFGYIDGNGNKITEEATETEAQEKIDSPATQEQLELFPPTQNLSELEVQNETESVEEEQNIPPEMAPMEEYTSDVDNFTDDGNVIIIEDEFVSEEEQAATLEAFNVEKSKMTGETVEESVEEGISKKPRFTDNQIPVKTEDFKVTDSDGNSQIFRARTALDGKITWTRKSEESDSFQPADIGMIGVTSAREALDVFEKTGSTVEVGKVGGPDSIMNPKMKADLSEDQFNRIYPAQQSSEAPVQSLGAIMSQEQILAEEEALRKEMEQLKNSLNKEDDNCAT